MSKEKRLERIDRKKLPLFYKVILKLPFPTISTPINIPSGIFWAMIAPIFIILEFFLNIYLLIGFSFPINILLVCIFPVAFLVIFIRATMNRFIDWWNSAVVGGYVQREIKKVLEEYMALRKDKDKKDTIIDK
jgi:hypothetical protein